MGPFANSQTNSNSPLAKTPETPILLLPDNFKFEPAWRDKGDCGPLALYLLMRLHGCHVTIGDVKKLTPFDPDRGCSLADLESAAERLGFPVETRFVNPRDLDKLPLPLIVHTEGSLERQMGHFDVIVAYYPEDRKYSIIDSTFGTVHKVHQEAILKNYTGYVLLTRRPLDSRTSHLLGFFFISLACVSSGIALFLFRKKKVPADGITLAGPETASITLSP
jgi:hypothetical protein